MSKSKEFLEVQDRVGRAKEYVKNWHENIERWRRLYNMNHYRRRKKSNEIQYCLAPETKVLTDDLKWVPVGDLAVDDGIVGFDEFPEESYARKFKPTKVLNTGRAKLPSYEITLEDGTVIIASENHKWLIRYPNSGKTEWRETKDLKKDFRFIKLSDTWETDASWDAGYVAAGLDGEGYFTLNETDGRHVLRLGFAQRDNPMMAEIKRILEDKGMYFSSSYNNGTYGDVENLYISRRSDVWKILGMYRPPRLLEVAKEKGYIGGRIDNVGLHRIVSVKSLGKREVVTLETESKTLLAEGYASHNSDPTYTNTVDLAVGIMLGNSVRWHSFGMNPTTKEQEETSDIEKLLAGTIEANNERAEASLLYQAFLYFIRDGGSATFTVFDPVLEEENRFLLDDEEGDARWAYKEVPVRTQVIDPIKIFALPGGPKRWLMLGRFESRSFLDIEIQYGVTLEESRHMSEDEKSSTMGEFVDAWDYVWADVQEKDEEGNPLFEADGSPLTARRMVVRNTIIFNNAPVKEPTIMDGYKELPYKLQFFKPTGDKSDDWVSILSPLESSISLLERSFNRRAHQIDVYTSLPIVTKTQPGRKVIFDPGLYNHVQITPDESIEFPSWPGNAPDVMNHMDFLRSRIQQSGFSDVMFGSGNSQVAGYALSQLGDQNRIRLEQPVEHLQLLLTSWAKSVLKLLEEFAPDSVICVYGYNRGKAYMDYVDVQKLKGYQVMAEIRPQFPNEETRKVAMSTQVKGTLSDYTIMEKYLDIEQPEEEEEKRIIEITSRHPAFIQYAVIGELKERADAGDEAAGLALQQLQAQVQQQQAAMGQQPPNPEQLTGLQSPDGQPVPQAEGGQPYGQSAIDQQNNMAGETPQLMEGA